MNNFETWLKADFPEADISRLPSGSYRVQSVRDMERAWNACSQQSALAELCNEAQKLGLYPEVR
jgi:hypothetical protein